MTNNNENRTSDVQTVVLCGVGGQGTILAADLLAKAAMASGFGVKVSEIHGMSQRGGAVSTVVRFGQGEVHSMVADTGCTDCIVSFETTEALRNVPFLKENGYLLVSDEAIKPLPVLTGRASMLQQARERLEKMGASLIPAPEIAKNVGSPKSTNVVLLGALATRLPFSNEVWEDVISKRVPPKTIEANIEAFKAGFAYAAEKH